MDSLYRPDELLSVPEFLVSKFGTIDTPPGQENEWRVALTRQAHESYLFFASNFVYIANKAGEMTLLKPFVGQAILDVAIDSQLRAGLPGRVCTVKARQLGSTTVILSRILHYCLDENKNGLILVDDDDVAEIQAKRLGTMLNGLPGWFQPKRRIQNLKHIHFDNPNPKDRIAHPGLESGIQITVPSSFRGAPAGIVCVSEYAHMPTERQQAVQMGVISAMPLTRFSILLIDTTPNSMDDSYYPMVMEAVDDNPKWTKKIENWKGELFPKDVFDGILGVPDTVSKGYPGIMVPAISPWRIHPEYTCRSKIFPLGEISPLTKNQRAETEDTLGKLSGYGGEEEIDARDRYGLSTERAFWRRRKIDGYKLPTEESKLLAFRQEFLGGTIESSFIDSGRPPFDRACLDALMRQRREPIARGLFLEEDKLDVQHPENLAYQEVRVYAPPQNGEKYTMGVDCDQSFESVDSDATVAQVIRYRDNKVVCTYEARVPSYMLILQLFCLYRWYFNAYYAIETKGMGYDLVRRCIDKGMNNVHYWKRYDAEHPEPSKYPGWETTSHTRPAMDQAATELICYRNRETHKPEPQIIIPDAKTLKEIHKLVRSDTGAYKSDRGHDDHYDAMCIAICIARDPYSGLHHLKEDQEHEDRKRRAEMEAAFSKMTKIGRLGSRNRPDLADI